MSIIIDDLQRALDDGMLPEDAAAYVWQRKPKAQLRDWAMPLLENEARDLARRVVQEKVRVVFTGGATLHEQIRTLAAETVWIPSRGAVRLLDVTPEEHRERAAWQRTLAGTIIEDAERHERWADEIEAAGVRCLAELEQAKEYAKPNGSPPAPRKKRPSVPAEAVAA